MMSTKIKPNPLSVVMSGCYVLFSIFIIVRFRTVGVRFQSFWIHFLGLSQIYCTNINLIFALRQLIDIFVSHLLLV
jgi:hypothetical protein